MTNSREHNVSHDPDRRHRLAPWSRELMQNTRALMYTLNAELPDVIGCTFTGSQPQGAAGKASDADALFFINSPRFTERKRIFLTRLVTLTPYYVGRSASSVFGQTDAGGTEAIAVLPMSDALIVEEIYTFNPDTIPYLFLFSIGPGITERRTAVFRHMTAMLDSGAQNDMIQHIMGKVAHLDRRIGYPHFHAPYAHYPSTVSESLEFFGIDPTMAPHIDTTR